MSQAGSPRPLAEQAARDAVERHWAVAALPVVARRQARVAADRAWEGMREPLSGANARATPLARRLTKSEAARVATAAEAYERAAADARHAALLGDATEGSSGPAILRIAAGESFRLARALPSAATGTSTWDLVRVAALAVVGDVDAERRAWIDHAERLLRDVATPADTVPVLAPLAWDAELQLQLPSIWLALLREPGAHDLDVPFEALGRLREQRADAEARQLSALAATDAAHLQLALAGLYGVADAAATLVVHMRRTMRQDVTAQLDAAFTTARAAVLASTPLGRALPWMQLAATRIARRQSAQIALPGLLG